MKTLNFITSNHGKLEMINQFVHEFSDQVIFEMLKMDFDELKLDDSLERTAFNKAEECIKLTNKENVVISDVGVFIKSLNGFPGVNTGFTVKKVGSEGILKLMAGVKDRSAEFRMAIAYVDKNGNKKVFTAFSDIEIADSIGGEQGFGWDNIALGNGERFSNNIYNEKRLYPFRKSIRQLVEYVIGLNAS